MNEATYLVNKRGRHQAVRLPRVAANEAGVDAACAESEATTEVTGE
jgi:hypothetical protein